MKKNYCFIILNIVIRGDVKKMKKLLILATLINLIPLSAYAKLEYCNKNIRNGCFELKSDHLITIKGLLYETGHSQTAEKKKVFLPHIAKTIVWLDKMHKDTNTHKLINLEKDDRAKLVNESVNFIIRTVSGYYPRVDPQKEITRWATVGEKVIAEYEEKTINNKPVVKYKLELKK
tara:strand:- start:4831 stop:5358 length:528 start_codon:yes stop_codon:yes gene_type:complete